MRKYSVWLILAGLLIILWPTLDHWIQDNRQQQWLNSWEPAVNIGENDNLMAESSMLELSQLFRDERQEPIHAQEPAPIPLSGERSPSNEALVGIAISEKKSSSPLTNQVQASKSNQPALVGVLEIPDIQLKLPVLEGVTEANLKVGAGHIPGTDAPGQIGNSVLAAHRSYSYGRLFNRLEQLNVGNEVLVRTANADYTYRIYEIKTVDPSDLSVLNRNDKDQVLTLITCTEDGTLRIVVHAQLITR